MKTLYKKNNIIQEQLTLHANILNNFAKINNIELETSIHASCERG